MGEFGGIIEKIKKPLWSQQKYYVFLRGRFFRLH
jgi:hypothetical protein